MPAANSELRGFDVRGATPYGYVPNRVDCAVDQSRRHPAFRAIPPIPSLNQCIQVPIPVYGIASIGGDTNFTTNAEYRIPIAGPVTFSFFDDFGIDVVVNHGQLKQSPEGFASLTAPLYGCPVYNNGACQGGIPGSQVGFQRDIRPISGTNFVPRMSLGGEFGVIMPVVNAPFRLYYAYNPLRLYERPYCNDVSPRRQGAKLLGGADHARHVPAGRRRRLHLHADDPGIRRAESLPRTAQDLPPDRLDHFLDHRSSQMYRAALRGSPSHFRPAFDCTIRLERTFPASRQEYSIEHRAGSRRSRCSSG